ncbi:MAG: hypothetical protein MUE44_10645 [Oscillatoriaceae cyanobacterium Prado104]|nr:hypothetical protein [Oscillatoriaceae cyanobacterium Prado104]
MTNKINFQIRYQRNCDTADGILLSYIQQHPIGDSKTLVLESMRAFWAALAFEESDRFSREFIERTGWQCVYTLLNQVERICVILGLDRSQLKSWAAAQPDRNAVTSNPRSSAATSQNYTTAIAAASHVLSQETSASVPPNYPTPPHQPALPLAAGESSPQADSQPKPESKAAAVNKNPWANFSMLSYSPNDEVEDK